MNAKPVRTGPKAVSTGDVRRLLKAANCNVRRRPGLKPASGRRQPAAAAPGPFEAEAGPGAALLTGLLVIYPVVASVAVALAGLWFLDASPL